MMKEKMVNVGLRFAKFNLIGVTVFAITTVFYFLTFPVFGVFAWLLWNGVGGILQFILITYVNKKRNGLMFEQCVEKIVEAET
jgi:hypothetical protein